MAPNNDVLCPACEVWIGYRQPAVTRQVCSSQVPACMHDAQRSITTDWYRAHTCISCMLQGQYILRALISRQCMELLHLDGRPVFEVKVRK